MGQIEQWVFFAGFLILAAATAVLAMVAIRQHRQSQIAAAHQLTLEHADDPILILDAQNRVIDLNAACQRLIGAETTIVNLKLGARLNLAPDCCDGGTKSFYVGYGHALTGARWYDDTIRAEYRLSF